MDHTLRGVDEGKNGSGTVLYFVRKGEPETVPLRTKVSRLELSKVDRICFKSPG